jgi:hypothetical protein
MSLRRPAPAAWGWSAAKGLKRPLAAARSTASRELGTPSAAVLPIMIIRTDRGWMRIGGPFVPGPQLREAGDELKRVFRTRFTPPKPTGRERDEVAA